MKNLSYQEALVRLEKLCSTREKCSSDISLKLESWGISEVDKQKIINILKKEKFLDDSRYAVLFVRDKLKINKWGREKIRFALLRKRLDKEIIESALSEIDYEVYDGILKELLIKKKEAIKHSTIYESKAKLINYGIQRGYNYDLVYKLVEEILKD